ncbi:GNAT family N-acetyltransferase [Candidatus Zixiibacteriota bacterium]
MIPDGNSTIIDATPETIGNYGICGYKNPKQPGYQQKLEWLRERFQEGMRIKVLYTEKDGAIGSIEYLPGRYAWRALQAPGYMVIHCLFILKKAYKGKGYGSLMIKACETDAREQRMYGVAAVASKSTWMAKKEIFLKNGYRLIEEAPPHYQLLVKRFDDDAPLPAFSGNWTEKLARYSKGLTILHSDQCPYVTKAIDEIPPVVREQYGIEPTIVELPDCRMAQDSPNPYGVFSIIWNGQLVADHPISKTRFQNIMNKLSE